MLLRIKDEEGNSNNSRGKAAFEKLLVWRDKGRSRGPSNEGNLIAYRRKRTTFVAASFAFTGGHVTSNAQSN